MTRRKLEINFFLKSVIQKNNQRKNFNNNDMQKEQGSNFLFKNNKWFFWEVITVWRVRTKYKIHWKRGSIISSSSFQVILKLARDRTWYLSRNVDVQPLERQHDKQEKEEFFKLLVMHRMHWKLERTTQERTSDEEKSMKFSEKWSVSSTAL